MGNWYKPRRINKKEPKRILVIVCEGETEKIYFKNYCERNTGLKIKFPNSTKSDPENLVEFAFNQITGLDLTRGDQVWSVFDTDHHKNEEIQKAVRKAGNEIKICLSNPSFELWYLLHFCYYSNLIFNKDLIEKLKKYIPNYSKTKDYFDILKDRRLTAINNAKRLNVMPKGKILELPLNKTNPSTQVFHLVEHILKTISANKRNKM